MEYLFSTRLRRGIVITVSYVVLTLVMTYPLILHFRDSFIGGFSDGSVSVWSMWWMKFSLLDLHGNPLDCGYLFYPDGVSLIYHSVPKALGLLSIPLQLVFGLTAGYNLIVIITFAGTAAATYWLVYRLTGARLPAFIAGALFAFSPYRWGQISHINLLSTMLIPVFICLIILGRESLQREDSGAAPGAAGAARKGWLYFSLAGLMLALIAYDTEYYAVFLLLFAMIFSIFYFPFRETRRRIRDWLAFLSGLALSFAIAAVIYSPFFIAARRELAAKGDYISWPMSLTEMYGNDLLSFVIPKNSSRLLDPFFSHFAGNIQVAETSYIGMAAIVPAIAGVVIYRHRRQIWLWVFTAVFFALCAVGPYMDIKGRALSIPTPYFFLTKVPLVNSVRTPSRFVVLAALAVAVLAGYGILGIIRLLGNGRWRRLAAPAIGAIALLAMVLEFEPSVSMTSTRVPPVYEEIAADGPGAPPGSIVTLPLEMSTGTVSAGQSGAFVELYQPVHQRPLIGGMVARAPKEQILKSQFTPVIDKFANLYLDDSALDVDPEIVKRELDRYGVRYIVVHKYYPELFGLNYHDRPVTIVTPEILAKIDRYATVTLGMEKFEETDEIVAYRRR